MGVKFSDRAKRSAIRVLIDAVGDKNRTTFVDLDVVDVVVAAVIRERKWIGVAGVAGPQELAGAADFHEPLITGGDDGIAV